MKIGLSKVAYISSPIMKEVILCCFIQNLTKRIINGDNFYGTFYGNKFIGIIVIQCYRSNGTVTGLETDSTVDVIMTKGLNNARKFFKEAKYNLEEELIKHKI